MSAGETGGLNRVLGEKTHRTEITRNLWGRTCLLPLAGQDVSEGGCICSKYTAPQVGLVSWA